MSVGAGATSAGALSIFARPGVVDIFETHVDAEQKNLNLTYIGSSFSFVEVDTLIEKKRQLRGQDKQCDEKRSKARGRTNQPSSSGAIYHYYL